MKTTLISNTNEDLFTEALDEAVTAYLAEGYKVSIQYQSGASGQTGLSARHSALVIATREGTWPT